MFGSSIRILLLYMFLVFLFYFPLQLWRILNFKTSISILKRRKLFKTYNYENISGTSLVSFYYTVHHLNIKCVLDIGNYYSIFRFKIIECLKLICFSDLWCNFFFISQKLRKIFVIMTKVKVFWWGIVNAYTSETAV